MAQLILAGMAYRSAEGCIAELALAGMTQHLFTYQDTISLSSRLARAYSNDGDRDLRDSRGAQSSSTGPSSELAHSYFRHMPLAEASHKADPDSEGGEIVPIS